LALACHYSRVRTLKKNKQTLISQRKREKNIKKLLGAQTMSFGPNVVHLGLFYVLSDVGVSMAVAVVAVDGVEKVVVG
jgi:hypothetical protein